jgi:hypothetical protein
MLGVQAVAIPTELLRLLLAEYEFYDKLNCDACRGQEDRDLYIHHSIRLHGVVLS